MHHETSRRDSNIFLLAVGSLGVVFGDIGTSPMYAIQESMLTPGLPAAAVVAGIDAQETKDALRANTEEAVARGAFGAPAMFHEGELFWGNDRLGLLEEALAEKG